MPLSKTLDVAGGGKDRRNGKRDNGFSAWPAGRFGVCPGGVRHLVLPAASLARLPESIDDKTAASMAPRTMAATSQPLSTPLGLAMSLRFMQSLKVLDCC